MNVVIFTITMGRKRWYVVRSYVPPNDQPAVHQSVEALSCGKAGMVKMLVGYLNSCLAQLRDQQEEDLATAIANHGLSGQSWHYNPIQRYKGGGDCSWRMWIDGRPISGLGDYIIGTQQRYFYNVGIMGLIISTYH